VTRPGEERPRAFPAARDASRVFPTLSRALRAAGAAFVLGLLWAAAAAALSKPFLPGPLAALGRLALRLAEGRLLPHVAASAARVALALLAAAPAAAALGLAAGRSPALDALASPFAYLLHPIPKVAFLPVIMLLLGLGDAAKVFLVALIIFGQLFVSARDASRAVPSALVDSVRSLGGGPAAVLRHVIFPAALPSLLSALRVGLGTSIAVLFIAETFAAESGLGWYIVDAWTRVDYPDMYAAIVALSLFGLASYLAVDAAEALFCRWRKTD
jgi:ABC-type nitrate/sulfonate/bicarbonate transport system permease component